MRTNKPITRECLCCYTPLKPTKVYAGHLDNIRRWDCPKCGFRWWWDSKPNQPVEHSMSARSDPHDTRLSSRESRLLKVDPPGEQVLTKKPILAYNRARVAVYRYHRASREWCKLR